MKTVFQVEYFGITNFNNIWVSGRFIEGKSIDVGNVFTFLEKAESEPKDIKLTVEDILMYNKSLPFLDLGMTGKLILNGMILKDMNPPFNLSFFTRIF